MRVEIVGSASGNLEGRAPGTLVRWAEASVGIEVRAVRAEEWRELRALRLRALADTPSAFGSTLEGELAFEDAVWNERTSRGAGLEDRATFVVADGGTLVGMATGLEGEPRAGEATLVGMFVAPEARRGGLGAALVSSVVAWAAGRGCARLVLWVTETNEPALALYRRCGFEDTGGRKPLDHTPTLEEWEMARSLLDGGSAGE